MNNIKSKYRYVFLFLIFISTVLSARDVTGGTDSIRTILFRVTNAQSQHVSYLFGTHHAFGKPFFESLNNTNTYLSECEILIKENLNIPGHMAEDIINRREEFTAWKKYLSNEDLDYVTKLFESSPTNFNKMTPTEMYVFLTRYFKEQVCLQKESADISLTLDDYIGIKAQGLGLQLDGLETSEEQIRLINKDVEGMPRKVHKRRLSGLIAKLRSGKPEDCSETEWYSGMNIDYKLDQQCQNTLILTDRNEKWIKQIVDYMEKGNCFIAVGLSHLMYECGLINKLSEMGYSIIPVEV